MNGEISLPYTEHIDVFFADEIAWDSFIPLGCNVYQDLVEHCFREGSLDQYVPLLAVSLSVSHQGMEWDFSNINECIDKYEPPSIYLLSRNNVGLRGNIRRIIIDLPIREDIKSHTKCYCWHDRGDLPKSRVQEFYRGMYIGYDLNL